jgi:hypothetical protein
MTQMALEGFDLTTSLTTWTQRSTSRRIFPTSVLSTRQATAGRQRKPFIHRFTKAAPFSTLRVRSPTNIIGYISGSFPDPRSYFRGINSAYIHALSEVTLTSSSRSSGPATWLDPAKEKQKQPLF